MEKSLCNHLRDVLIRQRNVLGPAHNALFRATDEKRRLTNQIADLENQVSITGSEAQIGRTASRFDPAGVGVAIVTGLDSQIRLSRLEGELAQLEQKLPRIEAEGRSLANELNDLKKNIPITEEMLRKEGCT